jgi:hypothetical protein
MSKRRPHTETELLEILDAIDVRAPQSLHERVQEMVADRESTPRRRAWPFAIRTPVLGGSVAVLAVLAIGLVLALSGGGSQRLTVSDASALALRAATTAAPAQNPHARGQLTEAVNGLAFPNWEYAFGYRANGARTDKVGGRELTTVFYVNDRGQRVGYVIAAAGPATSTDAGTVQWRGGAPYRVLDAGTAHVVTWWRDGHLCVIVARGVPVETLVSLASWGPEAA